VMPVTTLRCRKRPSPSPEPSITSRARTCRKQ
jgi:hypothetical protein